MYDFNQFLNNMPNTNNPSMPNTNNMGMPNTNNPNMTNNMPLVENNYYGYNNTPVMQGPCQVQNKCFNQFVPQPCNFHTHTVNTVIRKKYLVPTYTNSEETVFVDDNPCGCNKNNRRM